MKRAHARPALASLGSARYWPAFNLFRHKLKPDLVCAVPEDYPVPGFIDGSTWAFAGKISEPTTIPLGFESKAAEAGVRFNGFYLFQASLIERDTITVEQKRGAMRSPRSTVDGKYPPAKPGALGDVPLEAADGSLTRPERGLAT